MLGWCALADCDKSAEGERQYYVAGQKEVVAYLNRDLSRCERRHAASSSE